MVLTKQKKNTLYACFILSIFIFGTVVPVGFAQTTTLYTQGFDRGVAWKPYIPMKRTTFVQFDPEGDLDDYAFLAAVPTSVFYDKNTDQLFASPLLFYEDPFRSSSLRERTMNTRQGIDYFMEDWVAYCHGSLDALRYINLPNSSKNYLGAWPSASTQYIQCTDPYQLASILALNDWSYSEKAVVAVINNTAEQQNNKTTGILTGSLQPKQVLTQHFEVPKTNEVYPTYNEFTVPEGYKMIKVRSWYPSFYVDLGFPGFESLIKMSIPAGDRDLQIYCLKDNQWMMAGITNAWNAQGGMDLDKTSVYVYNSGRWSVALTDVPTKSIGSAFLPTTESQEEQYVDIGLEPQKHRKFFGTAFGRYGRILDILKNMRQVIYQIDVEMYPGVTLDIPELPPYGCRDVTLTLTWSNPSVKLGFSLIGPSGEEVLSTREVGVSSKCAVPKQASGEGADIPMPIGTETDMHLERLGECRPGEKYSICVYSLTEMTTATDFSVSYTWQQNYSKNHGDSLASATQGAVLASLYNAPLLYVKPDDIPSWTYDSLHTLGVQEIYLVDLGGNLKTEARSKLHEIGKIHHFTDDIHLNTYIRQLSGCHDVIFTTIDPYTYWYISNIVEIQGEMPGGLAIGPAAYLAATHGSPVLIIDNYPELSQAVVWHNELWRRHPDGHSKLPTVSEMYLTGKQIYSLLKKLGYDHEGEEIIITLGGQFDIGLPWDRVFVGKAYPGRFIDAPTDIAVWVAKTVFYPQLVFQNPALSEEGVTLINGSSSKRRFPWYGKLGLKITKPSQEETFKYPVLDTLVCYDHKFNSRASKYWGFTYTCADGSIPGVTQSFEPIDEGVMRAVNGRDGGFMPDLSGSEVQPFYLRRAGYDPVFSTNFHANMQNLNNGVVLWLINTHGAPLNGGMLMFWDVEGEGTLGYPTMLPRLTAYTKETNPWRSYEWLLGSTDEPDTMTMEVHGILPALNGNPDPRGMRLFSTALDWAPAYRPLRDLLGRLAGFPILRHITPDWLQDTQDYYDGVIITVLLGRFGMKWFNGTQIDDNLGNIHSAGVSSVACLPAGKYLHITLMRHGSVFQIMDPWATSWYSDVWQNGVPRGIALGQTIGQIYADGIKKVGIQYISEPPVWWWDLAENVCLYGDPNLRIWVPENQYSSMNHWKQSDVLPLPYSPTTGFAVDGHMPFGTTEHPNARQPVPLYMSLMWIIVIALIVGVLIIGFVIGLSRRRA
ncbi:MAG: hypothetical protein QXL17_07175 [Candidatus Thermoplasmatota archaeon]